MFLVILTEKKLSERFRKRECQKNQKELRVQKVIKRKSKKLYVKWKSCSSSFNSWIDKKDIEFFPEPKSSEGRVKFELDLSNYTTKIDLENVTGVKTSKCDKKVDLANLKSDVDKLDIDKFKNVPNNLSHLKVE